MQCVILAAGRGVRMLPLTEHAPKPLIKYKDKPILQYSLENLPREIDEVIFVIGYLEKQIRAFVESETLNREVRFVEQKNLNGTGGAITLCKKMLHDKFLIINGDDIYTSGDLNRLISHKLAILGSWSKSWKGSSLLIDENGNLIGIEKNPPKHEEKIANAGAYVLNEKFFDYKLVNLNKNEFSLPHTLVNMSRDHKIFVERASVWKHINTMEDL